MLDCTFNVFIIYHIFLFSSTSLFHFQHNDETPTTKICSRGLS
nr:MAG TPA: hypothetical protein [Caudoviricetes sp.]